MKRIFSNMTLKEAMQLVPATRLIAWGLEAPLRPPSEALQEWLRRLRVFNQTTSEPAKILLIDTLFAEIVPDHAHLRIWKAASLESTLLIGIADYIIAPDYAYVTTPLLCVAEAKRDDFVQGQAQCIAEMTACRDNNRQEDHDTDVYGIVSNGQDWQFYKLTSSGEVWETEAYTMRNLPELLGALDHVCAECARNVPA